MNCKNCGTQILDNFYFCPNCGNKLKEAPFKFSWKKTFQILLLSTLLPPFGIFPSIKYLVAPDLKAKIIGILGLILNILILSLATIYLINTVNQTMGQIDQLTNPQGSIQNQVQNLQSK